VGAIHRAPVQLQLAERAQLGQRLLVQGRPDAGRGAIPQPPPAGHPEQPTRELGSWFQVIPVLSTNTIPASAARSSIGRRPG